MSQSKTWESEYKHSYQPHAIERNSSSLPQNSEKSTFPISEQFDNSIKLKNLLTEKTFRKIKSNTNSRGITISHSTHNINSTISREQGIIKIRQSFTPRSKSNQTSLKFQDLNPENSESTKLNQTEYQEKYTKPQLPIRSITPSQIREQVDNSSETLSYHQPPRKSKSNTNSQWTTTSQSIHNLNSTISREQGTIKIELPPLKRSQTCQKQKNDEFPLDSKSRQANEFNNTTYRSDYVNYFTPKPQNA
jgi:hypothetical protein